MTSQNSPEESRNFKPNREKEDEQFQTDIFRGRKFTLADAIAKEGGTFLKGESPVPKLEQAKATIHYFIDRNLSDISGALQAILQRWLDEDTIRVARNLETPLQALLELLDSLVNNSEMLYEFVRQVDVKWGELNDERPHFQRPHQPPHPEDEYTHESVRQQLLELRRRVEASF
ncbi:hypothetical protein [Baaleninema simplex]|uniref:hypothetical protein n=1 Tax=Baaleninema simplex TaxID=2862350 RepID=UPI000347BB89|nr:hypothetical protein [Baaleninema simplex]